MMASIENDDDVDEDDAGADCGWGVFRVITVMIVVEVMMLLLMMNTGVLSFSYDAGHVYGVHLLTIMTN